MHSVASELQLVFVNVLPGQKADTANYDKQHNSYIHYWILLITGKRWIQIVCGSQNIKACIAKGGNRMKDCHPNTVPAIVAAEHRQHGKCTNHFNQKCSPQDKLRKPDDTAYIWR